MSFVATTGATDSAVAGQFNFNNATVASVTAVYMNSTSGGAPTAGDTLTISFGATFAIFQVSGTPTLSGSIYTIPVSFSSSSGTFTAGATYGTQGTQGIQGRQGTTGLQGTSYTSVVTAKGDLIAGTGSGTTTNLSVGNGAVGNIPQNLLPDSTQTSGTRWGDDMAILTIMQAI